MLRRLALWLARTRLGAWLAGMVLRTFPFALPAERLHQTATLLAVYHPRPAYPVHILILPRHPRPDLAALGPEDSALLVDLMTTVNHLVAALDLPAYRLIVNGGDYQDVPLLHFHLVSGDPLR